MLLLAVHDTRAKRARLDVPAPSHPSTWSAPWSNRGSSPSGGTLSGTARFGWLSGDPVIILRPPPTALERCLPPRMGRGALKEVGVTPGGGAPIDDGGECPRLRPSTTRCVSPRETPPSEPRIPGGWRPSGPLVCFTVSANCYSSRRFAEEKKQSEWRAGSMATYTVRWCRRL